MARARPSLVINAFGLASNNIHNRGSSSTPNHNAPAYVAVLVGDTLVNCLLDTGACYSICNQSSLPHGTTIRVTDTKLSGVTGTSLHVIGTADIPLVFDNVPIVVTFIVVENMKGNTMILGRDFLSKHQCELSYKNRTVNIQDLYRSRQLELTDQ